MRKNNSFFGLKFFKDAIDGREWKRIRIVANQILRMMTRRFLEGNLNFNFKTKKQNSNWHLND